LSNELAWHLFPDGKAEEPEPEPELEFPELFVLLDYFGVYAALSCWQTPLFLVYPAAHIHSFPLQI